MLRLKNLQKNTSSTTSTNPSATPTQQAREEEEQEENLKLSSNPSEIPEVDTGNSTGYQARVVVVASEYFDILSRGGDIAAAVSRARRHCTNADHFPKQPSDENKKCLRLF